MRFLANLVIGFALGALFSFCGIHVWMWQYWAFIGLILAFALNAASYR